MNAPARRRVRDDSMHLHDPSGTALPALHLAVRMPSRLRRDTPARVVEAQWP